MLLLLVFVISDLICEAGMFFFFITSVITTVSAIIHVCHIPTWNSYYCSFDRFLCFVTPDYREAGGKLSSTLPTYVFDTLLYCSLELRYRY
jgi:hypothetical protein